MTNKSSGRLVLLMAVVLAAGGAVSCVPAGRRVGDHVLDPGWTNYEKRVLYSVYDVTGLVRAGLNCVGVMLGNGWWNPLPLRMWGNRNLRADEARYWDLAALIAAAYRSEVIGSAAGRYEAMTQAGLAVALGLGLIPVDEAAAAFDALVAKVSTADGPRLATGIFGTEYLLDVVSRHGRADLAWALVDRKGFPGWGHMLERGATTLWEHWEFSDDTYSHNHPMFGSVSEWLFAWVAGIQPDPAALGFDRIVIRPQPAGDLT